MTLLTSERRGSRSPAYLTGPASRGLAGERAVDLAALAGLELDGWQQDALDRALAESADGRWAAFEVAAIVPRQNGKGSILEARELHALFCEPDSRLILHSAHEFKTAKEAFRRIVSLIKANPKLEAQVDHIRYTTGEEGIETRDGSRLRFVARSSGSGRGFTGDLIILDEAYNLSPDMMSALLPTMSARPNPQLWYTSSAPLPKIESDVLRQLCKRGRAGGSKSLAYFEWCAPAGAAMDDRDAWAAANPALGIRISEGFVERELEALGPEGFARERLGIWAEDEGIGWVIPEAAWAACEDRLSGPVGRVSFALDVTPQRDHASIAVAGSSGRGGVHVELVEHRSGTDWLPGRAVELQQNYSALIGVSRGSPAWALERDLTAAGVELTPVPNEEHAQACGALYDAVVAGRLRHHGQVQLTEALAGAARRDTGDAWLWSRKNSTVDISPLVAVTLAKWVWENAEPQEAGAGVW